MVIGVVRYPRPPGTTIPALIHYGMEEKQRVVRDGIIPLKTQTIFGLIWKDNNLFNQGKLPDWNLSSMGVIYPGL